MLSEFPDVDNKGTRPDPKIRSLLPYNPRKFIKSDYDAVEAEYLSFEDDSSKKAEFIERQRKLSIAMPKVTTTYQISFALLMPSTV